MGRPQVWDTLPSFRMWPKKTFFGLDKNRAHCFVVPNELKEGCIDLFDLGEGNLQSEIVFSFRGIDYPAEVRLARLKDRNVIFFQWPSFRQTYLMFRTALSESYSKVSSGGSNNEQSVDFIHCGGNEFIVRFNGQE